MFYRRKVLLALVKQSSRPLSLREVQLLLHLVSFVQQEQASYDFVPTENGPFSFTLATDCEILITQNLLVVVKEEAESLETTITIARDVEEALLTLKNRDETLLKETLEHYQDYQSNELEWAIYEQDPFQGIYTQNPPPETTVRRRIEEVKESIAHQLPRLYTLGYEGLSIEDFINRLIRQRITMVIDVRGNAVSMKRDFSKSRLAKTLTTRGFSYLHIPEVGIPTKARHAYLEHHNKEQLFDWYEKNLLSQQSEHLDEILAATEHENVVLMCYENDPNDCHRSRIAEHCRTEKPQLKVEHLR